MVTFSTGLNNALNRAILQACLPGGGVMPHLLDGTPKSLLAFWCGGQDGHPSTFQPERGDGRVLLRRPGDFLYFDPWFLPADHNIRAGVPLWLLCNEPGQEPGPGAVLALGVLHPLYCSATIQTYHPETGEGQELLYLVDPRASVERTGRLKPLSALSEQYRATQPNPMEWVSTSEQQAQLREMHGLPVDFPPCAPEFQ